MSDEVDQRGPSPATLPGGSITIPPELAEMLRVRAFLIYERDTTRDFVDFAEMSRLLEPDEVVDALSVLDEKFGWEKQPSIILEVTKALMQPEPQDRETNGFDRFGFSILS